MIVLEGQWNLEAKTDVPDAFLVHNVGSSPAFDIEITEIEGPEVRPHGYRERLVTDPISVVAEKSEVRAAHHRLLPGNQIDNRAVAAFMNSAGTSFGATNEDPDSLRPSLEFQVSYAALDGRRFVTRCRVRFWLGLKANAEIVPAASWLGENPT
ncbi:MAG TPA: hypothetical protein VMU69_29690 [Bradyrhizobium sp.]|nr:hypothetical protein [Bradyrhizobium sp.]